MNTTFKEFLEALWVPLCLSLMGFVVRAVRYGVASWRVFVSSLFCSAFVGILAHWFLAGSGINTQIASAVIAMSGYCGGALLDAIHDRILKEVHSIAIAESRLKYTSSQNDQQDCLDQNDEQEAEQK